MRSDRNRLRPGAARVDERAADGDLDGAAVWRRIMDAVARLANTTPSGPVNEPQARVNGICCRQPIQAANSRCRPWVDHGQPAAGKAAGITRGDTCASRQRGRRHQRVEFPRCRDSAPRRRPRKAGSARQSPQPTSLRPPRPGLCADAPRAGRAARFSTRQLCDIDQGGSRIAARTVLCGRSVDGGSLPRSAQITLRQRIYTPAGPRAVLPRKVDFQQTPAMQH